MTQLDLVIPGLCGPLPDIDRLDSESIRSMVSWLAKADRQAIPQKSFYDVLAMLFAVDDTESFPAAALSLLGCEQYTDQGHWFHADPVHLQVDMDHAILRDSHGLDLTLPESEALVGELNAHFDEQGIRFLMHNKDSWCLNISGHQNVSTTAVSEVISRNVYAFMPQGEDALFWKKIMNEVQMLLHQSPINEKRQQNGRLPVNGAWLWGEGKLPARTCTQEMAVYTRHSIVKGLAVLNDLNCHSISNVQDFFDDVSNESNSLLVLDGLFNVTCYGDVMAWQLTLDELYAHWLLPILSWAVKNKIQVNLYPCNGVCYQISSRNKFRFFRDKRIAGYIQTYE
ncbi:MAG: hypothetical protein OQK69_01240 [Gammaproteobacteria bacterium]|nr:hypothetical protein [Gammaproteobacteria bacterium]